MCQLVKINTINGNTVLVSELKKNAIENIIVNAAKCNVINAIILFGSSLNEHCSENSDIDVAVITNMSMSEISKNKSFQNFKKNIYGNNMQQQYDMLYFKSYEDIKNKSDSVLICREIFENGKIIYEKESEKNN